jgi:hypothetical protein
MSSHSSSSTDDQAETKTYKLGLFSSRLRDKCIASYVGGVKAKTEIRVGGAYYPRLKGLFPLDPSVGDIIALKKDVDGELIQLKSLNLSEIELSELKVVKTSGKPDKRPVKEKGKRGHADDDYEEETGEQILMQLPENVEISLEYSSSLELVFMRNGRTICLHSLVINNTDVLN